MMELNGPFDGAEHLKGDSVVFVGYCCTISRHLAPGKGPYWQCMQREATVYYKWALA